MIARYTRPEMGRIWSEEERFSRSGLTWKFLPLKAWLSSVKCRKLPSRELKRRLRFNVARIRKIEREVKHEIIAFLSCVAESIGDDARFLHVSITSPTSWTRP